MCAIDLSEIYSPERFKNKALRMGLSAGTSSHSTTSATPPLWHCLPLFAGRDAGPVVSTVWEHEEHNPMEIKEGRALFVAEIQEEWFVGAAR
eukprot:14504728-Heterocapsa_arctica.AAC.1